MIPKCLVGFGVAPFNSIFINFLDPFFLGLYMSLLFAIIGSKLHPVSETEAAYRRNLLVLPDSEKVPAEMSAAERAQMASDKNQVMDELLNQPVIPGDYGAQMIALFRDQKQDVVTRDFAVQHMGLYAQALNRRGTYSPDSAEARALRSALDEAVGETKSIVSAAAFRALADIAAFDPHVDGRRLDARLAACVTDSAAAPAARVMAAQLCGERRIASARPMLAALAADHAAPETLRRSAAYAVSLLDAK